MNHYIYLITNNINNKKYIGKRSCHCPIELDGYMGSGTLLHRAFEKYGIENFSKHILLVCDSEEQAFEEEKKAIELVNATKNPMYYNIAEGGQGGNLIAGYTEEQMKEFKKKVSESMKGKTFVEQHKNKISESMKDRIFSEEHRRKISENHGMKGKTGELSPMYGRTFSEETRKKMSESRKGELHPRSKIAIVEIDNVVYVKPTSKEMADFIQNKFDFKCVQNWFSKNQGVPKNLINRVSLVMTQTKDKTKSTIYHMNENCTYKF